MQIADKYKGPFVNGFYDSRFGHVVLRNVDGISITVDITPSFFIRKEDKDKFPFDAFPRLIIGIFEEGNFIRVVLHKDVRRDDIEEIETLAKEESNIICYEADIHSVRRFISDSGCAISSKYKSLYIDLETDPLTPGFDDEAKRTHRIISFAAYGSDGRSWFFAAKKSSDAEEIRLLNEFYRIAEDYDTILAWNGDGYDFFVIKYKTYKHKLKVNRHRWNWLDYMRVAKKVLASIPDPVFKRSFALDAIGENVLGVRKLKVSVRKKDMAKLLGDKEKELEEYNRQDVKLMLMLEEKKGFLALHYALCSICRTFPDHASIFPNELADGILLRLAIQHSIHFKSRPHVTEINDNQYEGAYVMDPVVGFHTNVQVPDFAALYPSVICSWNMSNETVVKPLDNNSGLEFDFNTAVVPTTGVRFRTDLDGIIPIALKLLIEKRKEYKKLSATVPVGSEKYIQYDILSTAVKVATNSFYGLLGSESSRYYDLDIARSVTLGAQYLIRATIDHVESKGYKTIYGDTDSIFVICSEDVMNKVINEINVILIPKLLKQCGCKENFVRIEYDKGFKTFLLIAKKRYAGRLSIKKGRPCPDDMEPEIKGIETQRSDEIRLTQKLLMKYINLCLIEDADAMTIDDAIRQDGMDFYNRELDHEEIEISESISKPLTEYKAKGPAIRVAEQLIRAGEEFFVGMKVQYIVTAQKPLVMAIPVEQYKGVCDRDYYWKKKILPPIERLIRARFPRFEFSQLGSPAQIGLSFNDEPKKEVVRAVMPKNLKRTRVATVTIPAGASAGIAKGISSYAKLVKNGDMKLRISIQMAVFKDDGTIDKQLEPTTIVTDQLVDNDFLKSVVETFGSHGVTVKPKPV